MSKSKHGNKDEYYRGELRQLEAENRRLKKQIRELEKQLLYSVEIETVLEEREEIVKTLKCPECYNGNIDITDLGIKILHKCNSCSYRKTKNK